MIKRCSQLSGWNHNVRCSDVHRRSGEPLYGSATIGKGYAFLPVPIKYWGDEAINTRWASRELLDSISDLTAAGVRVRLYDPDLEGHNHVYCFGPDEMFAEVERILLPFCYCVSKASGDFLMFICVHSRRDACCALYGQAAYIKASATWAGRNDVLVFRCSHLGGDRFAGTGVCFPSGNMYGAFGDREIIKIVAAELTGQVTGDHFRGNVFEDWRQQIVRYAICEFTSDWGIGDEIEIVGEEAVDSTEDLRILARLRGRLFAVRLAEKEFPFTSNCRALNSHGVRLRRAFVIDAISEC